MNPRNQTRSVALAVEHLEPRLVPDATSFVNGLYFSVLGRAGSTADVSFWVGKLQSGSSNTDIAKAFLFSTEHRTQQLNAFYQQAFNRAPTTTELNNALKQFNDGQSEVQVALGILTSSAFTSANPTNTAYVQALYQSVLGRPADAAGLSFWTQQLNNGTSQHDVALSFLSSNEAYTSAITQFYQVYEGRPADASGQAYWLKQLQDNDPQDNNVSDFDGTNSSYEKVAASFLTSAEFLGRNITAPPSQSSSSSSSTSTSSSSSSLLGTTPSTGSSRSFFV